MACSCDVAIEKKKLNKKKHNLYCLSLKREELLHINQLSLFSPSTDGSTGDLTGDSAEILFQSFLQEGVVNSSGMSEMSILNWCCPSSVSSADKGSPTLQGALKDGFGEVVLV